MNSSIISLTGETKGSVELADKIFNIKPNEGVIYDSIRNELANKRQGTNSTKGRSEVSGSTKKPWRQKGTGRARSGMRMSPIWRGGGIVFGPKPRDYSYRIPKKMKRLSIRSIFSKRNAEGLVRIVEDLSFSTKKTKDMANQLFNMSLVKGQVSDLKNNKLRKIVRNHRLMIITEDDRRDLKKLCRNITWVKCLSYNKLSSYDLFYSKEIMIEKSVLPKLEDFFLSRLK